MLCNFQTVWDDETVSATRLSGIVSTGEAGDRRLTTSDIQTRRGGQRNPTPKWQQQMLIHNAGKILRMLRSVSLLTLISATTFSSANAFDCKLASTPGEKAICADPSALAADEMLNKVFGELRTSLGERQIAELLSSQKRWMKDRDSCALNTGNSLAECIKSATIARTELLEAAPVSGTGAPGKLVPYFFFDKGGKGKTKVDIQVYEFAKASEPAQLAFNAEVNKLIKDIPQPEAGDPQSDNFEYNVSMSLEYASPKLISVHAVTETFLGGAHPNNQSNAINIDVAKGKLAQFSDLLDKAAAQKIFGECGQQVLKQKKENEGKDADTSPAAVKRLRDTISSVSGDLALWTFAANQAEIQYDTNVLGAHAEGVFFCTIPYALLRPLVRPGFPLP